MSLTDGTRTVNLASTDAYCEEFGLDTPNVSAETAADFHRIEFIGGAATVAANLAETSQLLDQAVRWQRSKEGPRVFIQYQLDGSNTLRSEVVDGSFQANGEMVKGEYALGVRKGTLSIIRRNWLERAEATATLVIPNTLSRVYNDGSYSGSGTTLRANYFDVDGTGFVGHLPAPVRLTYTCGGVATGSKINISVARSAARLENGAKETNWWESSSGWSANTNTDYTNSDYRTQTPGGSPIYVPFGGNFGTYMNRFPRDIGFYKMFCFMKMGTAGTYKLAPYFDDGMGGAVRIGKAFYKAFDGTNYEFVDCGGMYLPLTYSSARALLSGLGMQLGLAIYGASGVVVSMDWGHSFRADGWRRYAIPIGTGFEFEDEQIDGSASYLINSSLRHGDISVEGLPNALSIYPGKWHRYYVHIDYNGVTAAAKDAYITPTALVYRPRFLTLT
jgi:hypothetical protein